MRARNIKPALFKNELLGEADPLLTILFTGLWCIADKEGRLEDRPKKIRAEIFPYRSEIDWEVMDGMLDWLHDHGFINRYRAWPKSLTNRPPPDKNLEDESSTPYIQIEKFDQHQRPHHMETESDIPPPAGRCNKQRGKPIYKAQRERVLERDHHQCLDCGETKKLVVIHRVPVALGGNSKDDNLVTSCKNCVKKAPDNVAYLDNSMTEIVNESSTNRERIVENGSCPTDTGYLIAESLTTKGVETEMFEWNPSPQVIEMLTKIQGVPIAFIDEQLNNFRAYWSEQPHKPRTSWNAKFQSATTSRWQKVGHNWKPSNEISKRTDRKQSAIEHTSGESRADW